MKVVFTNGVFDLLHVGHVRLLHFARQQGDWLVVAINSDASVRRIKGPGRPIIPADERREMLFSLRCVDDVLIFDEDTPEPLIRQLRPKVLVKGPECQKASIPGIDLVQSWGGRIVVPDWPIQHSTTQIVSQLRSVADEKENTTYHCRR